MLEVGRENEDHDIYTSTSAKTGVKSATTASASAAFAAASSKENHVTDTLCSLKVEMQHKVVILSQACITVHCRIVMSHLRDVLRLQLISSCDYYDDDHSTSASEAGAERSERSECSEHSEHSEHSPRRAFV